jgi:hypothetical protein
MLNIFKSIDILSEKIKRIKVMYDRYGIPGTYTELPLGGAQYIIRGILLATKGTISKTGGKKKVVYKPTTFGDELIQSIGFNPWILEEHYSRLYGGEYKLSKKEKEKKAIEQKKKAEQKKIRSIQPKTMEAAERLIKSIESL